MPRSVSARDFLGLQTGGVNRALVTESQFRITNELIVDGKVGIGTTNPHRDATLDVQGIIRSSSGGIQFPDNSVQTTAVSGPFPDGHSLDASDGDPTDAVYVDHTGYVGIGTTNPAHPLVVTGNSRMAGIMLSDASAKPEYVGSAGNYITFGHEIAPFHPDNVYDAISYKNGTFYFKDADSFVNEDDEPNVVIGGGLDIDGLVSEGFTRNALRLPTTGGNTHVRFGRLGSFGDESFAITKNYWRPDGFEVEDPNTGSQAISFGVDGSLGFQVGEVGETPGFGMVLVPENIF